MATSLRIQSRSTAELPLKLRGREIWHKSAPEKIVAAGHWNDDSEGWQRWRRYLAERAVPRALCLIAPTANDEDGQQALRKRLQKRKQLTDSERGIVREQVRRLPLREAASDWSQEEAVEFVDWAYLLIPLAENLDADEWWDLLTNLIEISRRGAQLDRTQQPVTHQLLAGELPLALASFFPELKPCRRLATAAQEALDSAVAELLGSDGMIHASHLHQLRDLIACWSRVQVLGHEVKGGCWSPESQLRYRAAVRQSLRLLNRDARQVLASENETPWPRPLLKEALALGADVADRFAAREALSQSFGHAAESHSCLEPADPACQSDEAEYAVLRAAWSHKQPLLVVDHSGNNVKLELTIDRDVVFSGGWKCDLVVDGKPRPVTAGWEAVCWVSDEDVVYLELQTQLTNKLTVQRQILLARQDGFLFLNDVCLGEKPDSYSYRSSLACAAGVSFEPAAENNELCLVAGKQRVTVLPLALGEWRHAPGPGTLTVKGTQLEYHLASKGRAFTAPLFIDLDTRRHGKPLTWRPMTVAEQREIVPADLAVGNLVQIGKSRWLFYRALGNRGLRTVCGANLATEFLASRMNKAGELENLIEIE